MPRSTPTITARQRQAIYELVRDRLTGIGDICLALDAGDILAAERLGREFEQDLRLLCDLGWAEADERRTVMLTMPADKLDEILRRLRSEAAAGIAGSREEREAIRQEARVATRDKLVLATCDELIARLDPRLGEPA